MEVPETERTIEKLESILASSRAGKRKAKEIAEAIRAAGNYRWVGSYDVDEPRGVVTNLAWSGPSGPAFPTFATARGITSRAIATRKTVNVGDVSSDLAYLVALGNTRSEIIVPVFNSRTVVGTIDVESEHPHAFNEVAERFLEERAAALKTFWLEE